MNFPSNNSLTWRRILGVVFPILLITLFWLPAAGQSDRELKEQLAASASIEQCRNGTQATPRPCGNTSNPFGWVSGSSGNPQAYWNETEYIPYRVLFSGLPGNGSMHTIVMGYDILHTGVHAIDYLGTYNLTETTAKGNDPCFGVGHCNALINPDGDSQAAIPVDPVIDTFPAPRPTMPDTGEFTMWGGDLISCSYLPYEGGNERLISCTFTANVSDPVLAWGGHIGWQGDWGLGNSAGSINGNPYHMRLKSLDGASTGNQDLALSANAESISAKVTIVKDAQPLTGTTSPVVFDFTSNSAFGYPVFQLADNGILGDNTQDSLPITSYGAGNEVVVTESFKPGWTLGDISCSGSGFSSNSDLGTRTVTITVQEGAIATCTFVNQQLEPSGAGVSVFGRVLTSDQNGVYRANITLMDAETGSVYSAITNNFGYYSLHDIPVGSFYILTVNHRNHLFLDASVSFTLNDDMYGVDFTASEVQFVGSRR